MGNVVASIHSQPLFGADWNVEHPYDDYGRAASLERHTLPASETFLEPALEDSATVVTPALLQISIFQLPYHWASSLVTVLAPSTLSHPSNLENPRLLLHLLI